MRNTFDYLQCDGGEAVLRDSGGLCNLTEVIVRPDDNLDNLKRKVKYATILGTLQSTLTDFRYLRKIWKDNAEEERLLGISLTGIMDHPVISGKGNWPLSNGRFGTEDWDDKSLGNILTNLKQVAVETNKEWAEALGINPSKQLTLVKPSGTVSQLCDTSSGMHPRMFPYYIRRVTQDNKDPLTQLMVDQGVPHTVSGDKYLFEFPIKSPEGSITSNDVTALQQLDLWLIYKKSWCDGNPSQTIYYTDDEYFAVADWVWYHWDDIGGLSFFPKDDHVYENAPYQQITKEEYERLSSVFPSIDFNLLPNYEKEDCTTSGQTYACSGNSCEL